MKQKRFKIYLLLFSFLIHFNLYALIVKPQISSIVNNAINVNLKTWIDLNSKYISKVELDTISSFISSQKRKYINNFKDMMYLDSLNFKTSYYLRIKFYNSNLSDSSEWSDVIYFTTLGINKNSIAINPTLNYIYPKALIVIYTNLKIEFITDTTINYDSKWLSKSDNNSFFPFYNLKPRTKYFYKFRLKYHNRSTEWYSGEYETKEAYTVNSINNKYIIKNINANYYKVDSNTKCILYMDTTQDFNSSKLKVVYLSNYTWGYDYDFGINKQYYLKIKYKNEIYEWQNDTIYSVNNNFSPLPFVLSYTGTGYNLYFLKGTYNYKIEMDTSLYFNSPKRSLKDTIITKNVEGNYYYIDVNNFKKYNNMYLRYTIGKDNNFLKWTYLDYRLITPFKKLNTTIDPHFVVPYDNFTEIIKINIVFDTSILFNSPLRKSFIINKNDTIRDLKFGKKYYSKMRYISKSNDTSQWSDLSHTTLLDSIIHYFTFDTNQVFSIFPNLVSYSNLPNLKCVQLQLDSNKDFRTRTNFFKKNGFYLFGNLKINKKYYYRLRFISNSDTSRWFKYNFFNYKMDKEFLTPPILVSPVDQSKNINPLNTEFIWKENSNNKTELYNLYITNTNTNKEIHVCIKNQKVLIPKLEPNTLYTWKVIPFSTNIRFEENDQYTIFTFKTSGTNAVNNLNSNDLIAYPNPLIDILNLTFLNSNSNKKIEILDMNSKLLKTIDHINSDNFQIDMKDFSKGMYLLKYTSDNSTQVYKIIKQ